MNDSTLVTLIVSGILFGTPLALAAVGEILAERSGVLNLGLEGMMLVGAVTAFWASVETGSVWVAIIVAVAAGALMSTVVAVMSITLRVSQIVTGLGVVLFGTGLSSFIGRTGEPPLHGQSASATISPFFDTGPADWPVVGPILFGHDVVVYLTWAFTALASVYLFRTADRLGHTRRRRGSGQRRRGGSTGGRGSVRPCADRWGGGGSRGRVLHAHADPLVAGRDHRRGGLDRHRHRDHRPLASMAGVAGGVRLRRGHAPSASRSRSWMSTCHHRSSA